MSSGIQKNSIAFSSSWCHTEPYAFSRFNQMTWSSVLLFFAVFIRSHNTVVCQIQPGKPGTPAFSIDVLTYPLFIMNLVILFAITPKKMLLSTLSNEIGRNWSIFSGVLFFWYVDIYMFVYIYIYIYIYIYMYVCVCVYICICIYVYLYVYACVYIDMYLCMGTNTCAHI